MTSVKKIPNIKDLEIRSRLDLLRSVDNNNNFQTPPQLLPQPSQPPRPPQPSRRDDFFQPQAPSPQNPRQNDFFGTSTKNTAPTISTTTTT